MLLRPCACATLLALAAGCHLVFPHSVTGGASDRRDGLAPEASLKDGPGRERAADGRRREAAAEDGPATERSPTMDGAKADSPREDGPREGGLLQRLGGPVEAAGGVQANARGHPAEDVELERAPALL